MKEALETSQKSLHNLQVLHRDTYEKCVHLSDMIEPPPRILQQAMKEVYARHALTIESLAELVIGLRNNNFYLLMDPNNKSKWKRKWKVCVE